MLKNGPKGRQNGVLEWMNMGKPNLRNSSIDYSLLIMLGMDFTG